MVLVPSTRKLIGFGIVIESYLPSSPVPDAKSPIAGSPPTMVGAHVAYDDDFVGLPPTRDAVDDGASPDGDPLEGGPLDPGGAEDVVPPPGDEGVDQP